MRKRKDGFLLYRVQCCNTLASIAILASQDFIYRRVLSYMPHGRDELSTTFLCDKIINTDMKIEESLTIYFYFPSIIHSIYIKFSHCPQRKKEPQAKKKRTK